jgi:hypothetical protein
MPILFFSRNVTLLYATRLREILDQWSKIMILNHFLNDLSKVCTLLYSTLLRTLRCARTFQGLHSAWLCELLWFFNFFFNFNNYLKSECCKLILFANIKFIMFQKVTNAIGTRIGFGNLVTDTIIHFLSSEFNTMDNCISHFIMAWPADWYYNNLKISLNKTENPSSPYPRA